MKTTSKLTAAERNARELARVERENRASGINEARELVKNQWYSVQMNKSDTREAYFVRRELTNGEVVAVFRDRNGHNLGILQEDLKKRVTKSNLGTAPGRGRTKK